MYMICHEIDNMIKKLESLKKNIEDIDLLLAEAGQIVGKEKVQKLLDRRDELMKVGE